MTLHFPTRDSSRQFHAKRKAKALPSVLIDHGKDYKEKGFSKRYSVSLKGN